MASGPGKFWEYVRLKGNVWQTVRRINIEILGKKRVIINFESWKFQSESWKSPRNRFLKNDRICISSSKIPDAIHSNVHVFLSIND